MELHGINQMGKIGHFIDESLLQIFTADVRETPFIKPNKPSGLLLDYGWRQY